MNQYYQESGLGTAKALTDIPGRAYECTLQALNANVRYTLDGTAPSATRGGVLVQNDPPLVVDGEDLANVRLYESTGTAEVAVMYLLSRL